MQLLGIRHYDTMLKAIAACHRVDEVQEIRNKARALEVYAAQSLNHEAEDRAREIRIRAERRCGQLLVETQRNGQRNPGHGQKKKFESSHPTQKPPTLAELGLSEDHSSRCQKLAQVSEDLFEKELKQPGVTTDSVIRSANPAEPPPSFDERVLWVWGRCKEFAEVHKNWGGQSLLGIAPSQVAPLMTIGSRPRGKYWTARRARECRSNLTPSVTPPASQEAPDGR